jgi:hypothetical protein
VCRLRTIPKFHARNHSDAPDTLRGRNKPNNSLVASFFLNNIRFDRVHPKVRSHAADFWVHVRTVLRNESVVGCVACEQSLNLTPYFMATHLTHCVDETNPTIFWQQAFFINNIRSERAWGFQSALMLRNEFRFCGLFNITNEQTASVKTTYTY